MLIKISSLLLFVLICSCDSKQSAFDYSLSEYKNKQWLLSENWAKKSIKAQEKISQSQYMVGLCKFKRGNLQEARVWFNKAASSTVKDVRGKATAMLGIISTNEGDFAAAQKAFEEASYHLAGIDKQEALARTKNPSYTSAINKYTLQFGAYRDKTNAEAAISSLKLKLTNLGIPAPSIIKSNDRTGRTIYLVQAGRFASRNTASREKNRTGFPQCIVTSAN